jgi:dihydroorotate dehydrogenase
MPVECVDHEYYLLKGDKILALIRRIFHRYPEFRHDSFKYFARFAPFYGGHPDLSPRLKYRIAFKDRSNSIYLGCPVILAAGANKTAKRIADYANVGFGGITVGTATRNPREGNAHRPRIGFLEDERAMHNSMGLNNDGVKEIALRVDDQLAVAHKKGLSVGISVAETPGLKTDDEKLKDILETFSIAYKAADYIEINVSCPNTGEDRIDLDTSFTERLFGEVMRARKTLGPRKAVYAKLSPDLTEHALIGTMDVLVKCGVNGVVLGNTFPSAKIAALPMSKELEDLVPLRADGDRGGISGRPLYANTFWMVAFVKKHYPQMSVIACGGIDHGRKVYDLMKLGADAVECYSVVAFRWMAAHAMRKEFFAALHADGYTTLEEFLEKNR